MVSRRRSSLETGPALAACRRLTIPLLVALAVAMPVRAAPPPTPEVFVPNLWDPASPPPKPDPSALKPLLIVTGQDDAPFAFSLPDGTPAGFDVDLARALCDELKVTCTVQARRWDTILPAIAAGAGDAAVASLALTEANLRAADFTAPYYRTPARFVAPVTTAPDEVLPETVKGRRIGVQGGTAHEAYLKAFFPAATLVTFGSDADLRAALVARRIDLAFGDGIGFSGWLNGPVGQACCTFAGGPFTETRYFGEGAGIAVQRGRQGLRVALDYALWRLAQDGTYADLWLKYFPVSPY